MRWVDMRPGALPSAGAQIAGNSAATVTVRARSLVKLLGLCIVVLVVASTLTQELAISTDNPSMYGLVPFLKLDAENNLPTWFSSTLLLIAAALLWMIAVAGSTTRWRRHWLGLSGVFLYLSADETSSIHEKFIRPVHELFELPQLAYTTWLFPFGLLLIGLAVAYGRWFVSLPRRTRTLALAAGVLYIGGAAGLELLALVLTGPERQGTLYRAISTLEETFEMSGALLWLVALIDLGVARGIRPDVRLTW